MAHSHLITSPLAAPALSQPAGRVAVFDLDRTLVPGSSLVALGRAMATQGMVRRRQLVAGLARDASFRRRGASDADAASLRDDALRHVAGLEVTTLEALLAEVGQRVAATVRPAAMMLVRRHLLAGDFVVVLSASPQALVEVVATLLGAHRAVGTRPQVCDGRYTGKLDGPFCYGEGKLERLRADVGPGILREAVAYADSMSDLPVLEACREPVAVNPDRRLRAIAEVRRWPVLDLC